MVDEGTWVESLEHLDELREKIAVGLVQAERGELLDGEDVFRELEQRFVQPTQG